MTRSAKTPQAPRKVRRSEPIRHVPSGRTMPTAPNGKRKRSASVVRNLLHEFNSDKNPKKRVLFPLVD